MLANLHQTTYYLLHPQMNHHHRRHRRCHRCGQVALSEAGRKDLPCKAHGFKSYLCHLSVLVMDGSRRNMKPESQRKEKTEETLELHFSKSDISYQYELGLSLHKMQTNALIWEKRSVEKLSLVMHHVHAFFSDACSLLA